MTMVNAGLKGLIIVRFTLNSLTRVNEWIQAKRNTNNHVTHIIEYNNHPLLTSHADMVNNLCCREIRPLVLISLF